MNSSNWDLRLIKTNTIFFFFLHVFLPGPNFSSHQMKPDGVRARRSSSRSRYSVWSRRTVSEQLTALCVTGHYLQRQLFVPGAFFAQFAPPTSHVIQTVNQFAPARKSVLRWWSERGRTGMDEGGEWERGALLFSHQHSTPTVALGFIRIVFYLKIL